MTSNLSKSKNQQSLTFLANSRKLKKKFDWLGYPQSDEKTNRCLVSSQSVFFWNGITLFKKCQTFFHQTSKRFHSVMATLESQKYVIAWTVWTENILLVSGRLVWKNVSSKNFFCKSSRFRLIYSFSKKFLKWPQSCRKSKIVEILTFLATSRKFK